MKDGFEMPVKRRPTTNNPSAGQAGFVARLQMVAAEWPSADRLAKATGVSASAFRKWMKGEAEPSRDRLVALAAAAGVSLAWLAQGEGAEPDFAAVSARANNRRPATGFSGARFLVLPKVPEAATAGSGHAETSEATEFVGFRHDWLRTTFGRDPADLTMETAIGESMEPRIRNGDILLVDTSEQTFRNFGVYVIEVRDERLIKRVQRKFDGSLVLISDNPVYQPEFIDAELAREVRIIGRVVWRGGSL
jgi:phage repressor protein C with HTH and peptisase S24 domain